MIEEKQKYRHKSISFVGLGESPNVFIVSHITNGYVGFYQEGKDPELPTVFPEEQFLQDFELIE